MLSALAVAVALPLRFQQQSANRYAAANASYSVVAEGDALRLRAIDAKRPITIRFEGALAPRLEGSAKSPATASYFIGSDPAKWRTGVPLFESVRAREMYRGIDVLYHTKGDAIEFDVDVAPGADARAVRLRIDGVDSLSVNPDGTLVMKTRGRDAVLEAPLVEQNGHRIGARYRITGKRTVAFDLDRYDTAQALLIDPTIGYRTIAGGSGGDVPTALAIDGAGATYVAGQTGSTNFAAAGTPYQGANAGGKDAFIAKFNAAGTLVYATYLGGGLDDGATSIAVDSDGIYVGGNTKSANFPTAGAIQGSRSGGQQNGFVTKLALNGASLVFSTYFGGGSSGTSINGLAVDALHDVFITGSTTFLVVTTNGVPIAGKGDAFVAALNPTGSGVLYSTYLGGNDADSGNGIAVDGSGGVYVTGTTQSSNFPMMNPVQNKGGGGPLRTTNSGANWSPSNSGFRSGFAQAIAFDPTDASRAFASGVNNGFDKSIDGGATWTLGGQTAVDVTAIVVDPNQPQTMYMSGSLGGGVRQSIDGGVSFQSVTNGLTNTDVLSLAIDPTNHLKLVAGTGGGVFIGSVDAVTHAVTWTQSTGTTALVRAIAIDPSNTQNVYIGTQASRVLKSINGGASFASSFTGIPFTPVRAIAVDPSLGSTIFAGTDSGLYRSTNSAATWTLVAAAGAAAATQKVNIVTFWPKTVPATLVTGGVAGMWQSANSGANWTRLTPNSASMGAFAYAKSAPANAMVGGGQTDAFVCRYDITGVQTFCTYLGGAGDDTGAAIAFHDTHFCVDGTTGSLDEPVTPNALQPAFAGGTCDGYFACFDASTNVDDQCTYQGGSGADFCTSIDYDGSAVTLGCTTTSNDMLLLNSVQDDGGATNTFVTTDNGASWLGVPRFPGPNLVLNPFDSSEMYSWHNGLWKSTDAGSTWTDVTAAVEAATLIDPASTVAMTISDDEELYIFAPIATVKSGDHASTFTLITSDIAGAAAVAVSFMDGAGHKIVMRGGISGVRRTQDGGATWTTPTGAPTANVTDIAVTPTNPNLVIVAADTGIFKSVNAGVAFAPTGALIGGIAPYHAAIDSSNTDRIYVGSHGGGIFLSQNSGNTYTGTTTIGQGSLVINSVTTKRAANPGPDTVFFSADKSEYKSDDALTTVTRSGIANVAPTKVIDGPGPIAYVGVADAVGQTFATAWFRLTHPEPSLDPEFATYFGESFAAGHSVFVRKTGDDHTRVVTQTEDGGAQSTTPPTPGPSPVGQSVLPATELLDFTPGTDVPTDLSVKFIDYLEGSHKDTYAVGATIHATARFHSKGVCSTVAINIYDGDHDGGLIFETASTSGGTCVKNNVSSIGCSVAMAANSDLDVSFQFHGARAGEHGVSTQINGCEPDINFRNNSHDAMFINGASAAPDIPTNVDATVNSNDEIEVHWNEVFPSDHVEVFRKEAGFDWHSIGNGNTSAQPFIDPNVVYGHTYVYRLEAVNGSGTHSDPSTPDLATPFHFTYPIVAGQTGVHAIDFEELRTVAEAIGDVANMDPSWTHEAPLVGKPIAAQDIKEVNEFVYAAEVSLGLLPPPVPDIHTNSPITKESMDLGRNNGFPLPH